MKNHSRNLEALVDRLGDAAEAVEKASRRSSRSARSLFDVSSREAEHILGREWRALKRDLNEVAEHTDLDSLPDVKAAVDRIRTTLAEVGESVEESAETVRRRTTAGIGRVDTYAHDSPWQTAGFAALAGVAIGLMIGKR